MQLLLEYNANPNASWEGYGSALQFAAFKGDMSIFQQLLLAKADINLDCKAQFDVSYETEVRIQFKISAN